MPFGCYRRLSHFLQLSLIPHGSYLCPSYRIRAQSSFLRLPFHLVRSQAQLLSSGQSRCTLYLPVKQLHQPCANPMLLYPRGSIYATYVSSFAVAILSSPAAHTLACLAVCHSCEPVIVFVAYARLSNYNKNICQALASQCCCPSPFGLICPALWQAYAVTSGPSSLPCLLVGAPVPVHLHGGQVCHLPLLLLAAGAITICQSCVELCSY